MAKKFTKYAGLKVQVTEEELEEIYSGVYGESLKMGAEVIQKELRKYEKAPLRFVYRFDGQPWLQSAITPHSGSSNTLSPFVALETRD